MSHPTNLESILSGLKDAVQQIASKITLIEENQSKINTSLAVLNDENSKRAEEIKILARQNNALLTEDEETETEIRREQYCHENESSIDDKRDFVNRNRSGAVPSVQSHTIPIYLLSGKDIIRTIETLNGKDDVGVQDFIRRVKKAKLHCSQPELLLHFILTEQIIENAKRAICYVPINTFDDLYTALLQNMKLGVSVELCRAKLDNCRQGSDTVQAYNLQFRQALNELNYATQAEHSNPTA